MRRFHIMRNKRFQSVHLCLKAPVSVKAQPGDGLGCQAYRWRVSTDDVTSGFTHMHAQKDSGLSGVASLAQRRRGGSDTCRAACSQPTDEHESLLHNLKVNCLLACEEYISHTHSSLTHVRTLPSSQVLPQYTVHVKQQSPLKVYRACASLSATLTGLLGCILLYEMYYLANNPLNAQSEVKRRFYKSVDEPRFHGRCPYSDLAR
ncbi:hypothetical protein PO909_004403 [Leuciscus waleckii]